MIVDIVDLNNQAVGSVELDSSIFAVKCKMVTIKEVVKWQLAKRRQGSAQTKTISYVSGTTRKPYSQKRTGRARQGSLRSPQFRGGAVIFGPVLRSYEYSLNKKVRSLALKGILSYKCMHGKVVVCDDFDQRFSKTTDFVKMIKAFQAHGSSFLIVDNFSDSVGKACRNLDGVDVIKPVGLNVLDVINHDCVIFTSSALSGLKERFS